MDEDMSGSDGNTSDEGDVTDTSMKNLVRLSADGGSTQSLGAVGAGEDTSETSNHDKQTDNQAVDLDKDIDSMAENSARYCQVGANASVSIGSIPADSTLDTTDNVEERVLDGAPSEANEVMYSDMDMNGNEVQEDQERQVTDVGEDAGKFLESVSSERSYTSEYSDSSAFAESVVRSAIDRAVNSVRMPGSEFSPSLSASDASLSSSKTIVKQEQDVDDLLQPPQMFGGNDDLSEDNDVNDSASDLKPVADVGDVKVGLFQYMDAVDLDSTDERVRSPEVSEVEENADEALESMTDVEKDNILKMYGLEGIDPVSPKSASPSDSGNFKIDLADLKGEEREEENKVYRDIQREVYVPQTRNFSINRDPSSSESTPRYDSARLDEQQIELQKDAEAALEAVFDQDTPEAEDITEPAEPQYQNNAKPVESSNAASSSVPQTISPPLVQYESIKENGKFRIVKMPKEGGQAGYSGILGSGDTRSPKQSPRDSETQESPRSQSSIDQNYQQVEYDRQGTRPQDAWLSGDIGEKMIDDQNSNGNTKEKSTKVESVAVERAAKKPDFEIPSRDSTQPGAPAVPPKSPPLRESPRSATISYADKNMELPPSPQQLNEISKSRQASTTKINSSRPTSAASNNTRDNVERDVERIKYKTTQDTSGRETKRTGPLPFKVDNSASDPMLSDSRFLDLDGTERREDVPYDRERYAEPRPDERQVPTSNKPQSSSRYTAAYEHDLIRSAYDRVTQRTGDSSAALSASMPARSRDTGIIPGYRTLQEQQHASPFKEANWSSMFRTLEEQHRRDLHSQYEHHQYNIQRLQQQMELELQKQHVAIRRKIDLHKDALEQSSLNMESLMQNSRSPDRGRSRQQGSTERSTLDRRSLSGDGSSRSQERSGLLTQDKSQDRMSRSDRSTSRERSQERSASYSRDLEVLQNEIDPRSWREIYHEVRAEEDQLGRIRGQQRSPRSQPASGSPRSQTKSAEERSRSFEKKALKERDLELSVSRDIEKLDLRSRSPEGQASRSEERYARSSIKDGLSPRDRLNQSTGSGRSQTESVSPHVQELLHNLDDSRTSLRGLDGDVKQARQSGVSERVTDDQQGERPRAGVYSSPMPMVRGKGSKGTKGTKASPRDRHVSPERPVYDSTNEMSSIRSPRAADQSSRVPGPHDYAEFHSDSRTSGRTREMANTSIDSMNASHRDTRRHDESYLSYSSRMNLREKHSKHLADLRAYYEDELRDLRQALSDSLDTTAVSTDNVQSTMQNQLLEAENRHLLDKCRTMEDEIEELHAKIRATEQKNHGVEKRAAEYSAALADMQAMSIQHKAHIEELQRYCRERDDLVNDVESKVRSNEDSVKIYKKNLEEELELHRQDKIALQRIVDKYESLEREYKLLQETMNSTENKLYETRTEIVELNRTMSKIELENKRLGRENDNLRHKVTQSLNLSALHESFGSPSSPRNHDLSQQPVKAKCTNQSANQMQESMSCDQRMPGFAVSSSDWSASSQKSKIKDSPVSTKSRSRVSESTSTRQPEQMARERTIPDPRERTTAETVTHKSKKAVRDSPRRRQQESVQTDTSANATLNEDVSRKPVKSRITKAEIPTRDITPERPASPASGAESDVSDYSPLIKAERELYKLRDMMRQAVAIKQSDSPPQPKLQKKFYGSERPSSKDDYTPDLGPARGRKEKPGTSGSHKSVAKTKTSSTHSLSDKTADKPREKKSQSGKTKSKDGGAARDKGQRKDKELDKERMRNGVNGEEFNTSTRFDINIDEEKRTVSVTPRKENQSGRARMEEPAAQSGSGVKHVLSATGTSLGPSHEMVDNTLDMMRGGQYTTRPQWENMYTSMAQARQPEKNKQPTKETTIKDRMRTISEMESRYDGLQMEKRQLESSLNKIPLHGRVDRHNRMQKEELEGRLDDVEKELGSLRMSLKRYNVLKTAG